MPSLPRQTPPSGPVGHMIVYGDDTLAHRLATELHDMYGEDVVLVVPPAGAAPRQADRPPERGMAGVLRDRALAVMARASGEGRNGDGRPADGGDPRTAGPRRAAPTPQDGGTLGGNRLFRVLDARELHDDTLVDAGAAEAAALALVHEDDETNIRAALVARRINPRLRLVIRLYNRKLGEHLAALLDQAGLLTDDTGEPMPDGATTVLSDADTAAPALAAAAVADTSRPFTAGGVILRAVERPAAAPGTAPPPDLPTLALLSGGGPAPGRPGHDRERPELLPDDAAVAAATDRGRLVLEAVTPAGADRRGRRTAASRGPALTSLFSRRVRWSLAGLAAVVLALAVATWLTTSGIRPLGAVYLVLLDLFGIDDPAKGAPVDRQILQLLAGTAGLLLLPVGIAAVLEALGTFRSASALRRPSRTVSGHVVLLGLGKIGSRVLRELRQLGIAVVCVEEDPTARGVALARRLRVPTVIGDVTQEGVLEAAKIERADALLALTSKDTTNLEAVLYARSLAPGLRVALRLYDDDFSRAVYRTMRAAYPGAPTRSRSVSTLAAPAFAVAMMGRQIVGAIPVERRVLLVASVAVAGHPQLEGRTVGEVFSPGVRRILALDAPAAVRSRGGVLVPGPDHMLRPEDRVVLAVTRRGLAELLGRQPSSGLGDPRTR